jgi:hypothetical protein
MSDHKEVRHERLYLKEPGTERLRKGSAARLRYLLASGWRETERWYTERFITARVERSGVDPAVGKMPHIPPPAPRPQRQDNRRGGGGPGGRR